MAPARRAGRASLRTQANLLDQPPCFPCPPCAEPLCQFLEVDVPEAQFPRLNDSKMFIDRIIDGSLIVLGEWRKRGGEVERPELSRPASG